MIDNTAFFSVMAPYMPLRPFHKNRETCTMQFLAAFLPDFLKFVLILTNKNVIIRNQQGREEWCSTGARPGCPARVKVCERRLNPCILSSGTSPSS